MTWRALNTDLVIVAIAREVWRKQATTHATHMVKQWEFAAANFLRNSSTQIAKWRRSKVANI